MDDTTIISDLNGGTMKIFINGTNTNNKIDITCNETDTCKIDCQSEQSCHKLCIIFNCVQPQNCQVKCNELNNIACPMCYDKWTTLQPTNIPTIIPLIFPTNIPTDPTNAPSTAPTVTPTVAPTVAPSMGPSITPTTVPTTTPSMAPSTTPTNFPTDVPIDTPTDVPTDIPSQLPTTDVPTLIPTDIPSKMPIELVMSSNSTNADGGGGAVEVLVDKKDDSEILVVVIIILGTIIVLLVLLLIKYVICDKMVKKRNKDINISDRNIDPNIPNLNELKSMSGDMEGVKVSLSIQDQIEFEMNEKVTDLGNKDVQSNEIVEAASH